LKKCTVTASRWFACAADWVVVDEFLVFQFM